MLRPILLSLLLITAFPIIKGMETGTKFQDDSGHYKRFRTYDIHPRKMRKITDTDSGKLFTPLSVKAHRFFTKNPYYFKLIMGMPFLLVAIYMYSKFMLPRP